MIHPYFSLRFTLSETAKSVYFLAGYETDKTDVAEQNAAAVIAKLPEKKRRPYTGKKYIEMDDTQRNPQAKDPYCFSLGQITGKDGRLHHGRLTGFQRYIRYPSMSYGNDKNPYMNGRDAIMILWADGGKTLTLFFFSGLAEQDVDLFNKWTAGNLCLTVHPIAVTTGGAE
jgi:hypothetical protein